MGTPKDEWFVSRQGERFGPVDQATLEAWVRQGRLRPGDSVWQEGTAHWVPAWTVPGLFAPPPPQVSGYSPPTDYLDDDEPLFKRPHRGGLILTLGILSVLCCLIIGPVTWVMARNDLEEMDHGRMDRSGRGLTMAGMVLGIIGTFWWLLAFVLRLRGVV